MTPDDGWEFTYVLHLTPPYGKRGIEHYLGRTCLSIDERMAKHRNGEGAALLRAQLESGGDFVVALAVQTRREAKVERALKRLHVAWRTICPLCSWKGARL